MFKIKTKEVKSKEVKGNSTLNVDFKIKTSGWIVLSIIGIGVFVVLFIFGGNETKSKLIEGLMMAIILALLLGAYHLWKRLKTR